MDAVEGQALMMTTDLFRKRNGLFIDAKGNMDDTDNEIPFPLSILTKLLFIRRSACGTDPWSSNEPVYSTATLILIRVIRVPVLQIIAAMLFAFIQRKALVSAG